MIVISGRLLLSSLLIMPNPVGVMARPTMSLASVGSAHPAVPAVCGPTTPAADVPPPESVEALGAGVSAIAGPAVSPAVRTPIAAPRSSLVAANRDPGNREG